MNPEYPVYIPSKGRWDSRLTVRACIRDRIPYRVVVEPQEYTLYSAVIPEENLLVLPHSDQGLHTTRNWIMEHSRSEGHAFHWQIDDNIEDFHRFNNNLKVTCADGSVLRIAEQFVGRFDNVAQAGFNYYMFIPRKQGHKYPPVYLNTRIYSCTLNRNDLPFKYRSWYNDDTDYSLQCLKAGWCTILFNAFLADKKTTMTIKGGLKEEYQSVDEQGVDGRLKMARALVELHPDVVQIIRRWGRWQHQVNYAPFKGNKLKLKSGVEIPRGNNEYGMVLEHKVNGVWTRGDLPPTLRRGD